MSAFPAQSFGPEIQALLYAGTKAIDHPGVAKAQGPVICGQRRNLWVLSCLKWTELAGLQSYRPPTPVAALPLRISQVSGIYLKGCRPPGLRG